MTRKPIIFERDALMARRQRRLARLMRLGVVLLVLLAMALASAYFHLLLSREEQAARNRLRTFAELRTSALSRFLSSRAQETALWASQADMQQLARQFIDLWRQMTPRERARIRRMLAPAARGKAGADAAASLDTTRTDAMNAYLALHRKSLADMQAFLEHHGYADIHFITPDGDLVFSVHKHADFGQNLALNGSIYAGRALGQAFQRALRLISPGMVIFEDFQHYPEEKDPPRAFFAAPLLELEGGKIGVLAIELDTRPIDTMLDPKGALGPDARIYAVGPDLLMRNNLPNAPQPTALARRVDTPAVRQALAGQMATSVWRDGKRQRIAVASPMSFDTIRWAVVTEMPLDEMRAPYQPYRHLWMASLALILLLGAALYWFVRRD